jgi:hypothetical protein
MSLPRRNSLGRGRARAPCPRLPTVTALQTVTPSRDPRGFNARRPIGVQVRNFGRGVLTNPYLARCGVSLLRLPLWLSLDLLSGRALSEYFDRVYYL